MENLGIHWYLKFIFPESVLSQLKLEFLEIWTDLISNLDFDRETLVLRDFHADNLMWLPDRTGIQKCGLLDYQDAVSGHPAYDIMSLIQDARRDLQQGLPADLLSYYHSQSQAPDRAEFDLSYIILSAQRHCKVIGIFSRLAIRDGKHQYLSHISRCWELLKATCLSSELIGLNNWLAKNVPVESSIVIDKIIS